MTAAKDRLDAGDFEARYRADFDPWRYETSEYEQNKYQATLAACGPGPFEAAVELGGSIGVFSSLLAPRCRHLLTLDASPTAVRRAQERLATHQDRVQALVGRIPGDLPSGRCDLIVASEVLYYLTSDALAATIDWVGSALTPGGRLVCVHWRVPGPERALTAEAVHAMVGEAPRLIWTTSSSTSDFLLDCYERR